MPFLLFKFGEHFYQRCYPLYRPLYSLYKAVSDRGERRLLREHLRPGMTVVDLGANIGIYSLFFASLVGEKGRVHSFEPAPANFARLAAAVRGRDNIEPVAAAAGAQSGQIALHLSDALNVDHRAYATGGEPRRSIPIRCVALDDYFPPGTRVDFLKADIQGSELTALEGATRVLADNPQLKLLLEYSPYLLTAAGRDPRALLDFFARRGLHVSRVGPSGRLGPLEAGDHAVAETVYCNLFVTPAALPTTRP
jgi:FkbM family methyltransferase